MMSDENNTNAMKRIPNDTLQSMKKPKS